MFKSIFLYLKNIFYKYILRKEIEEDPNIDEDLLRLFTTIANSPTLFEVKFYREYSRKYLYDYYLELKNINNKNQVFTFYVGYLKKVGEGVVLDKLFSEFYSENPNFEFKNLILPEELKDKLFSAYLYRYTTESKVNELLTSLTFGVKND